MSEKQLETSSQYISTQSLESVVLTSKQNILLIPFLCISLIIMSGIVVFLLFRNTTDMLPVSTSTDQIINSSTERRVETETEIEELSMTVEEENKITQTLMEGAQISVFCENGHRIWQLIDIQFCVPHEWVNIDKLAELPDYDFTRDGLVFALKNYTYSLGIGPSDPSVRIGTNRWGLYDNGAYCHKEGTVSIAGEIYKTESVTMFNPGSTQVNSECDDEIMYYVVFVDIEDVTYFFEIGLSEFFDQEKNTKINQLQSVIGTITLIN